MGPVNSFFMTSPSKTLRSTISCANADRLFAGENQSRTSLA